MGSGDSSTEDVKRIDDTPATTIHRIGEGLKAPAARERRVTERRGRSE